MNQSEQHAIGIRFVAEYQLFSDSEGRQWMHDLLWEARYAGTIQDFEVTGSYPGLGGLQLVTFTVDVPLAEGTRWDPSLGYDEAKAEAKTLLREIVGESDVEVRWVSPIDGPGERVETDECQCYIDPTATEFCQPVRESLGWEPAGEVVGALDTDELYRIESPEGIWSVHLDRWVSVANNEWTSFTEDEADAWEADHEMPEGGQWVYFNYNESPFGHKG